MHAAVSRQEFVSDVSKWSAFARPVEGKGVEVPGVHVLREKSRSFKMSEVRVEDYKTS